MDLNVSMMKCLGTLVLPQQDLGIEICVSVQPHLHAKKSELANEG